MEYNISLCIAWLASIHSFARLMINVLRIFCCTILRLVEDNQMHLKDEDAAAVVVVVAVVFVVVVFFGP